MKYAERYAPYLLYFVSCFSFEKVKQGHFQVMTSYYIANKLEIEEPLNPKRKQISAAPLLYCRFIGPHWSS